MRHIQHMSLASLIGITVGITGCETAPPPAPPVVHHKPHHKVPAPTDNVTEGAKTYPGNSNAPLESTPLPGNAPTRAAPPQPTVNLRDGSNIPAFRSLIEQARQQIDANQLDSAEQTLIQAQRMAPQSTAVYAYLSEVAIDKRQGSNAEAMARKGLMLTNNPRQQRAFWQLILSAAQLQNNAVLAAQAKEKIQQLGQ